MKESCLLSPSSWLAQFASLQNQDHVSRERTFHSGPDPFTSIISQETPTGALHGGSISVEVSSSEMAIVCFRLATQSSTGEVVVACMFLFPFVQELVCFIQVSFFLSGVAPAILVILLAFAGATACCFVMRLSFCPFLVLLLTGQFLFIILFEE